MTKSESRVENWRSRVVWIITMTAETIAELVDRHAAALVLFSRQWCPTPEDAVQDAFCKLAAQRTAPRDPVAWLYCTVKHRSIDLGKTARRRQQRETVAARPERWFQEVEADGLEVERAVAALQSLPSEQREVIVARLWGEMTLEQVASALGCSTSSAHRRYEAGIRALQLRLEERPTPLPNPEGSGRRTSG
jgi:RNA polymerase sigma-70 factor (ECF subfamily)